ncbi:MAG: sensor domain-containing diguanylate cyclase [Rhodocyclaceae bacterium]|nr:sensor domain-containing diguanylate cyclase [Rhodocyclaceae bacterium]
MLPAPIPVNESERIDSLRRMLLLSTPDEESFDRITRIAQRLFKVPIVLVSLIDTNRQWFKSCIGLPTRETGRGESFCGHAILGRELFVVEDARQDARFSDNPLVVNPPHVIFYAGRPLQNSEGHLVGTLCVIDHVPRAFSPEDRRALNDLGHWVEAVFMNRDLSETQQAVLQELAEARRGALLDPLVNLWTHDAALEICQREVKRAFDGKRPLSVLLVKITNLDAIRAQHGNLTADTALIEAAKCLVSLQRSYDTLGRCGHEEFIAILPDADPTGARALADRVRQSMECPFIYRDQLLDLRFQLGLASADFVHFTPQASELVDRARANIVSMSA